MDIAKISNMSKDHMNLQRTVRKEIFLEGVGVHSGKPIQLKILPALPNYGIIFVRTDLENRPEIAAHYKNIVSTQMATTLGKGQVTISTVEHLMAALYGLQIDNARIEVNGAEIPILDGSSQIFYEALSAAGTEAQLQPRFVLCLKKKIELRLGEKWAVAEPSKNFRIFGSIEWDHPSIGYQEFIFEEGKTHFEELALARTFGFLKDVTALKKLGLARGGSLDNAVVLDDAQILNPEGLRTPDEFVRHKVLDALGDFMLAGMRIQGSFRLHRAGHDLHSQLLEAIFKDPSNFEIVDSSSLVQEKAFASPVTAAVSRSLVASLSG